MTKKSDKIKEIHNVVIRLFAQKGYHNTSMREIARGLNMNQSSLYHYFDSKEDILFPDQRRYGRRPEHPGRDL